MLNYKLFLEETPRLVDSVLVTNIFDRIKSDKSDYSHYQSVKIKKEAMKEIRASLGRVDIPCCRSLYASISAGESIGFGGRNKFIHELFVAGFDEDFICKLFLSGGDPRRYGVLEPTNDTTSGFKLNYSFSKDKLADMSIRCSSVIEHCDYKACYRSTSIYQRSLHIHKIFKGVTFNKFRETATKSLNEGINSIFEDMI